MTQENEVTPSTTNTAARELLELIDQYWDLAHAEGLEGRMTDTEAGDAQRCRHEIESRIKALTQQQGGEQEAGEVDDEMVERACKAAQAQYGTEWDDPSWDKGNHRAKFRDAMRVTLTAALHTKQPAASEQGTINGANDGASTSCRMTIGQAQRVQTADAPPSTTANTSKQAAGEAVDKGPWRWLWNGDIRGDGAYELQSADFTHDAKIEVSGDFADHADVERYMLWLRDTLNATTPPRHPADEE